jgi:hypothetical protein
MPTILRIKRYRIGFYQADLSEPIHVHVRKQNGEAKYWMDPVELAGSKGLGPTNSVRSRRFLWSIEIRS